MNARRRKKLASLRERHRAYYVDVLITGEDFAEHEMRRETPQQCFAQARHERRVMGKAIAETDWDLHSMLNAVWWNQPPGLWVNSRVIERKRRARKGKKP